MVEDYKKILLKIRQEATGKNFVCAKCGTAFYEKVERPINDTGTCPSCKSYTYAPLFSVEVTLLQKREGWVVESGTQAMTFDSPKSCSRKGITIQAIHELLEKMGVSHVYGRVGYTAYVCCPPTSLDEEELRVLSGEDNRRSMAFGFAIAAGEAKCSATRMEDPRNEEYDPEAAQEMRREASEFIGEAKGLLHN